MKGRLCLALLGITLAATVISGPAALGTPYLLISSQAEWEEALGGGGGGGGGMIEPMTASGWHDYMMQWDSFFDESHDPYPENMFLPPDLYVYPGGGGGGGMNEPEGPGLVMAWGDPSTPFSPIPYSSAWKWEYGLDPDLTNTVITVTVLAPQFDRFGNQINVVSFGMEGPPGPGLMGPIRSWFWNIGGANPIQWNVPTQITINNSMFMPPGVNSTIPPANGFANNPAFLINNVMNFVVDENFAWVGPGTPVPPPGQVVPRMWNYWQNLVVAAEGELEFGDAPEGAPAYPAMGVIGRFPTCKTVGPASWIQHTNFGAWLGPGFEFEPDGNGGLCPIFAPYDNDECFMDGDAGLLFPPAYTIQGGIVTLCPQSAAGSLGIACQQAVWGANIDVDVSNFMPNQTPGWLNVLIDWDQNGAWAGASQCPLALAPEHVLVNFPIFNGFSGPVSSLGPLPFVIGPNAGEVWMRVSITERPVVQGWDGSGSFEDGETEDYLIIVDPRDDLDFGDAPDSVTALGYPTLSINNGARHPIVSGAPWLGDASDAPDAEPDGQPDLAALGDDNDILYPPPNDDEDGVTIPVLVVGQSATIGVEVASPGWVDAWIDWNGNQAWEDPAERIWGGPMPVGVNPVIVTPPGPFVGQTFGRFRIHTDDGTALPPTGPANDGEVEDHEVIIEQGQERLDFGDAPDNPVGLPGYPTLLINNGARHGQGAPILGPNPGGIKDLEPEGQPTANADGDDLNPLAADDEDGVTFQATPLIPGQQGTVTVSLVGPFAGAILSAWVDFNGDYSWAEAGDQIFVAWPLNPGPNVLNFPVPATATPNITTYARFRVHTNPGGIPYNGFIPYGEVEDYTVEIGEEVKWLQPPDLSELGIDVFDTQPLILADDFLCTKKTLLTDIRIWGSWRNDVFPNNDPTQVAFRLSIHKDIPDPDGTGPAYSMPGPVLWLRDVAPGQFLAHLYNQGPEGFWDPRDPLSYVFPGDRQCWEYDFTIPRDEAFCQQGTPDAPEVYWLDVQAVPLPPAAGCVLPDNGTGTADLPPEGCVYPTPVDDMQIIDGLPPGTTIDIDSFFDVFVDITREPGGTLGGEIEKYKATLHMPMVGTGMLAGWSRGATMAVSCETHTGPRTLGDPVQTFPTDMARMQGQITGDPDFDLLRVTAGTTFGLPSPGSTTLTQLPGGNWQVDSFFDITYRIDFVGAPGGPLAGLSGSTTGNVRFESTGSGVGADAQFGWKTSSQHWNDDAVWGEGVEPFMGPWNELRYPPQHPQHPQSIDLAFAIDGEPCPPKAIAWRSVRNHGTPPTVPYAIPLDPLATDGAVVTECRKNGIQLIEVDFDEPVSLVGAFPHGITVTDWPGGVSYTPTSATMVAPANTTLQIRFNAGLLPNKNCYTINLNGCVINAAGVALGGDTDCLVRGLYCDVNNTGDVDLADMLIVKSRIGFPIATNFRYDVNVDGSIDLADMLITKSRIPDAAACP